MDLVPKPSLVEKQFWLLDISGEEVDGVEQIWVWGIDEEGHPCILVDKGQKTRFYIAFDDKDDAVEAKKKFGEVLKKQGEHVELTLKEMKRLGKPVYTVEVNCQPRDLQNLSKRASEIFGERKIFEDDIRFSQRFLIDQDIVPSNWHLATAEKICDKKGIDFYAMQGLKRLDLERPPKLMVMGFDAIYYSKVGEADPERDPVAIISLHSREGEVWQYNLEEGEKKILEEFIEVIGRYDPDVLVGFEANSIHWSYLLKRAERYGVSLAVGRLEREPHQSLYGHFSVAGRINFDLNDYTTEITAIERKTLEELATYLGISMDGVEAVDPFLHSRKWVEDRESLLKYSEWRAEVMVKAFELISDHVLSLSSTTGIPTDYVQTASPGFRLDNYIMREASKTGELIPKPRDGYSPSYTGGRVLSPIPGLHSNIAVVDFKALYPSLMVKHNISPDTVVTPPFPSGEDILIVPEVEVGILQRRKGFFTEILKRIMEKREETRQRMKRFSKGTADYKLL
ncbi:MAG: hypothetical protein GTO54_09890, partial [Nitrososphaeria archaeon]|nr:hypothetical protein [Nitrososphaeria archaeon]